MADKSSIHDVERDIMGRPSERNTTNLDLKRMKMILDLLGDPQDSFRIIHITGTNGKGSTARMAEAICRAYGMRTGLYTSPHLEHVNERIAIDGQRLSDDDFVELWDQVKDFVALVDAKMDAEGAPRMSFFEVLTAMAIWKFADAPVDVAIIEVGMGGRWDATNVLDADAAVIGPIDMDHMAWLGDTVEQIAQEKVGIIKPGCTAIIGRQPHEDEVMPIIEQAAAENHATLVRDGVEAEVVARSADAVIAVVGDVVQLTGETCSTATLELLGGQNQLLERMVNVARETHKPLIVVLISSKPQVLPPCIIGANGVIVDESPTEGLGAFIWAANPGMQGGRAIAEIIFGMTEPSGRLPITFPRHAGQLPVFYNEIRGQHGDRYADLTQDPAFAFGEGLSYTTFAYGEPCITNGAEFTAQDAVHVEIDLTNTGARTGTEVVQLYISDVVTSYTWACKELKDFRRVTLEPGETARVAFDLPVSACTIVNGDAERIVEPGEFKVLIGHSSRYSDLHATIFNVVEG